MTRKAATCPPKKPAKRKPPAQKAEPKRPALQYEPSIRWLGRWVPGFHDY